MFLCLKFACVEANQYKHHDLILFRWRSILSIIFLLMKIRLRTIITCDLYFSLMKILRRSISNVYGLLSLDEDQININF